MIVFTLSNLNGELVHWQLGREWSEAVRNGEEYLPSPWGGWEKIILEVIEEKLH
jgi:hypothetical protein